RRRAVAYDISTVRELVQQLVARSVSRQLHGSAALARVARRVVGEEGHAELPALLADLAGLVRRAAGAGACAATVGSLVRARGLVVAAATGPGARIEGDELPARGDGERRARVAGGDARGASFADPAVAVACVDADSSIPFGVGSAVGSER